MDASPPNVDQEGTPMLVLSRQRDESIMIGDSIVVTIVDIRGDKVRLGISAPAEVPVHRQEVYEAIQRENQRAARLEPGDTQDIGRFANRGGHRPGGEKPR
jgi:carbon storage regulator